ncbi:MAG: outer membrane beta-barrel protein [Spirochaetota bacterium]
MKRTLIVLALLALAFSALPALAVERDIQGKLGTGYSSDPAKFGLDLNFQYNWVLDPYFAIGLDSGLYWIRWERKIGTEDLGGGGGPYADVKADSNVYMLPVLADAQIRLPVLKDYIFVTPYATIGFGYSFMLLTYSQPDFTDSNTGESFNKERKYKFFTGLTWQLLAGAGYQFKNSKVEFFAEAGYRSAKLKSGDLELDMSGLVMRIGAKYPLGVKS